MLMSTIERTAFRYMNALVEPAVRLGGGWAPFAPAGLIVLETRGRHTGEVRSVPLLATQAGPLLVVATVRSDASEWLRNVETAPAELRVWRSGVPFDAAAVVVRPRGITGETAALPRGSWATIVPLRLAAAATGWSFVVLDTGCGI
jgi:hypothetical protein